MTQESTASLLGFAAALALAAGAAEAQDLTFLSEKTFWHDGMAALVEAASTASGLPIAMEEVSQSDKFQAFLQTSIASNSTPAMFTWWNGNQLADLVEAGVAADLSANWDRAIAAGQFSEAQRELVSVDGAPHAVLLNVANWVVFYNTEAFETAGIAETPDTWEELMAAAEAVKAAGYVPFNSTTSEGWTPFIWFSQLMAATNPDAFVGLTDGSVPYDGPEAQLAFDIWADMYSKGYFTDAREPDPYKFFADETAAMFLIGDWAAGLMEEKGLAPGEDFGTFLMPAYTPETELSVIVEAAPIVVSAAALEADPDLGRGVDALMSAEASSALSAANGVYNGNLAAPAPNAVVEANMALIEEAQPRILVRWWEAVPTQIQGDLVAAMGAFMLDPTPENATATMAEMQAINADYWAGQ